MAQEENNAVKEYNNQELNAMLPKATAEKFKVTFERRTSPAFRTLQGEFDLRKLSVKQAELLVKGNASWIVKKEKNDPTAEKGNASDKK